jgi:sortase A
VILRIIGRFFIAAGIVILLFLAYELWGTKFVAQRNQRELAKKITFPSKPVPVESPTPPPNLGDGIARLEIPKIDANWIVVEGVTIEQLKKGPGHFPGTAYPGDKGNVVISGHRATYGEPFARMNEVQNGDIVKLTTLRGVFEYTVVEKKIVKPTDLSVVQDFQDERLTLTTCEPRYGSKLRMIVVAKPNTPAEQEAA